MKIIVRGAGFQWEQAAARGPKDVVRQLGDLDYVLRGGGRSVTFIREPHDGADEDALRQRIVAQVGKQVAPAGAGSRWFSRLASWLTGRARP